VRRGMIRSGARKGQAWGPATGWATAPP